MRVANFASSGIRFSARVSVPRATRAQAYVKVSVPRSCIGTPPRVRVAVVGYYDENPDGRIDHGLGAGRESGSTPGSTADGPSGRTWLGPGFAVD